MSSSRRCDFFKAVDGQWYMTLGDREYAYDDCNCTTYGPFVSEDKAWEYREYYFVNPGGSCTDDSGTAPVPETPVAPRSGWSI